MLWFANMQSVMLAFFAGLGNPFDFLDMDFINIYYH